MLVILILALTHMADSTRVEVRMVYLRYVQSWEHIMKFLDVMRPLACTLAIAVESEDHIPTMSKDQSETPLNIFLVEYSLFGPSL
jgi:DNA-binding transcriptional regulator WhiA